MRLNSRRWTLRSPSSLSFLLFSEVKDGLICLGGRRPRSKLSRFAFSGFAYPFSLTSFLAALLALALSSLEPTPPKTFGERVQRVSFFDPDGLQTLTA